MAKRMTEDRREALRRSLGAEPVERARETARRVAEEEGRRQLEEGQVQFSEHEVTAIQLVSMLGQTMAALAQSYGNRIPAETRNEVRATVSDLRMLVRMIVGEPLVVREGLGEEEDEEEDEEEEES